jgi:hypothetical protein
VNGRSGSARIYDKGLTRIGQMKRIRPMGVTTERSQFLSIELLNALLCRLSDRSGHQSLSSDAILSPSSVKIYLRER